MTSSHKNEYEVESISLLASTLFQTFHTNQLYFLSFSMLLPNKIDWSFEVLKKNRQLISIYTNILML